MSIFTRAFDRLGDYDKLAERFPGGLSRGPGLRRSIRYSAWRTWSAAARPPARAERAAGGMDAGAR